MRGDLTQKMVNSSTARPLDGPHIHSHFIALGAHARTHAHCPGVPLSRPPGTNLSRNRKLSDGDGDSSSSRRGRVTQRVKDENSLNIWKGRRGQNGATERRIKRNTVRK